MDAWLRRVVICAALFAAVYIVLDLNRLYALRIGSNTGTYLQTAVNFLRHGSTFNYSDWKPELAMHDQWMMLALVPLVAVWPRPESVIVLQVITLAAAAIALYLLSTDLGAPHWAAGLLAVAFLISPSIQGFAYGEFVPVDFIPLLAFLLALAVHRRSLPLALLWAQLLLGIKEDVGLFLIWFAAIGAICYDRRLGLGVLALALTNLGIYQYFETHAGYTTVHPTYGWRDPDCLNQLAFLAEITAPFAFAPVALGARLLLAVPLLAELFLAQHWSYPLDRTGNYYTAALVTTVAIAAALVIAQRPRWARWSLGLAIVMALFFNVTVLHIGRHPFSRDPLYAVARAWAISGRPVDFPCEDQGAWVVAAGNLDAKLVHCDRPLSHARPAWKDVPLGSEAPWTRGPEASSARAF